MHSLRHTTSKGGIVDRTSAMVSNLSKEIAKPTEAGVNTAANQPVANSPSAKAQSPVPVEVRQAALTPLQLIYAVAAPLLQPFATAGIVVVFVIFFLLQREDLRDRFIRLAGASDLRRTTVALDDAARRLSRYLLTQTAINASFGLLVGS
jgi:predicted PurR-regulated permease PerM